MNKAAYRDFYIPRGSISIDSNTYTQPSSMSGEWKMLLISSRSESPAVFGALYVLMNLMITLPLLCAIG